MFHWLQTNALWVGTLSLALATFVLAFFTRRSVNAALELARLSRYSIDRPLAIEMVALVVDKIREKMLTDCKEATEKHIVWQVKGTGDVKDRLEKTGHEALLQAQAVDAQQVLLPTTNLHPPSPPEATAQEFFRRKPKVKQMVSELNEVAEEFESYLLGLIRSIQDSGFKQEVSKRSGEITLDLLHVYCIPFAVKDLIQGKWYLSHLGDPLEQVRAFWKSSGVELLDLLKQDTAVMPQARKLAGLLAECATLEKQIEETLDKVRAELISTYGLSELEIQNAKSAYSQRPGRYRGVEL